MFCWAGSDLEPPAHYGGRAESDGAGEHGHIQALPQILSIKRVTAAPRLPQGRANGEDPTPRQENRGRGWVVASMAVGDAAGPGSMRTEAPHPWGCSRREPPKVRVAWGTHWPPALKDNP